VGLEYPGASSMSAIAPILVLLVIVSAALWVYADAKAHRDRGTPVVFSGFITVDTPGAWFVGCLFLGIIFFPLYLAMRGHVG
jgi:hypothetical protein